jgi:hypothetical protein
MTNYQPIPSFEALLAQLETEKIPFRRVESEPAVSVPTRLGDQESILHIRWEAIPGVIQFIQVLPLVVPEEQRNALTILLNRINLGLPVLGFALNESNGIMTYRTQAFLDGKGAIPPGLIGALIAIAARTAEKFLPQLQAAASA